MEVILMEDVDRVGHEGDVTKVADGYARNYLIPRGLATQATRGALKDLLLRRKAIEAREETKRVKFVGVAEELSLKSITVKARAGQGTRLHGQVTPQMIAEAAKSQLHMDLDKRNIEIAEPIRELGDFLIGLRLYKDVHAQLPVSVVRDGPTHEEMYPGASKAEPLKPAKTFEEVEAEAEADAAFAELEALEAELAAEAAAATA
jgi:large subunit ribosomal protein L9